MRWLIMLGIVLLLNLVASGKYVIWPAAWLLPILLVWLFRHYPQWYKFWFLVAAIYIGNLVSSQGITPLPPMAAYLFILFTTLVSLIPFWLDRRFHQRRNSFIATLVLPVTAVLLELLNTLTSPWGSWGSAAYSQADNLLFAQFASVFGIYGITFLLYWTASVANYVYEHHAWSSRDHGVMAYVVIMLAVLTYGGIQLATSATTDRQIRVAAIVKDNLDMVRAVYEDHSGKQLQISDMVSQADPGLMVANEAMTDFLESPFQDKYQHSRAVIHSINDSAIAMAETAAFDGAKVITWFEGQFYSFDNEEVELIKRMQAFAAQHHVTLLVPMAVITPGKITPGAVYMKNQIVVIDPQGEVTYIYHKARPVPGVEPVLPGDGIIPVIDAEGAKLSPVICYDADFPDLIRQSGQNNIDILFIPSGDWYDIRDIHMDMARFRAIENGVNVVRPANHGISAFIDPYGRIEQQISFFQKPNQTLMADIAIVHHFTLYSYWGDMWVYPALLLLAVLLWRYHQGRLGL